MSNAIEKCIVITFFIVNNPYPCHPYMVITENYLVKESHSKDAWNF